MKKTLSTLALLAIGLLVATSAMAFQNPLSHDGINIEVNSHGIRHVNDSVPAGPTPPIPEPIVLDSVSMGRAGPTQPGKVDVQSGTGGALVVSRGAAMASPKQQADMQIRRVIRSLY